MALKSWLQKGHPPPPQCRKVRVTQSEGFPWVGFAQGPLEGRKLFPVGEPGIGALPSKDPEGKRADGATYVPGPRIPRQGNAAI